MPAMTQNLIFDGVQIEAPSWVNWIASDINDGLYGFEDKPVLDTASGESVFPANAGLRHHFLSRWTDNLVCYEVGVYSVDTLRAESAASDVDEDVASAVAMAQIKAIIDSQQSWDFVIDLFLHLKLELETNKISTER